MPDRMKKWKILNLMVIIVTACILYMEVSGETIIKERKREPEAWILEKAVKTLPFSGCFGRVGDAADMDESTWALMDDREYPKEEAVNTPCREKIQDLSKRYREDYDAFAKERFSDFESVIGRYYTVDSVTYIRPEDMEPLSMLQKNMTINTEGEQPKILIFHTHSQEAFVDSVPGEPQTTIVGIGSYLTELLNDKYHIPTLHHEGVYDLINGKLDRSEAYQMAKPAIKKLIKDNPSIEVVIDLHRDGVNESTRLVTEVNGKPTAKIMFFNGMCRTRTNGNLKGISNRYLNENLSFSMQMKMTSEMLFPGFTRKNYLKGYKYNMDYVPRTLLIEAGAQNNTLEEMKNAMEPLAQMLYLVLTQHP